MAKSTYYEGHVDSSKVHVFLYKASLGPLICATASGSVEKVRQNLYDKGTNTETGNTAPMIASSIRYENIVNDSGPINNERITAFMRTVTHGYE